MVSHIWPWRVVSMEQMPVIKRATGQNTAQLADILGDAFCQDTAMNFVLPHPAIYDKFFRLLLDKLYMEQGHVYLEEAGRGAALWLPPGVNHSVPMCATQLWLVLRLVLHVGPGILSRLQQAQDTMEKNHPRQPHYYLHAIGARQASQGQGIGSALLKAGTRVCDEARMPAYLESSSERNAVLYQRHGFEIIGREPVAAGGPPLHFMWREPRPPG